MHFTTNGFGFTYFTASALEPQAGPTNGGTEVLLSGANLEAGVASEYRCRFGSAADTVGTLVLRSNEQRVRCLSPPGTGAVAVSLAINAQKQFDGALDFEYYPTAAVAALVPPSGPTGGGTALVVKGFNFRDTPLLSLIHI